MKPFKRRRRGGVVATFEPAEASMLANLSGQVIELLRDRNGASESEADPLFAQMGLTGPIAAPEDPVLRRLLPDAYRNDPEDAAEFRRFTEQLLSSSKVRNAELLIRSLMDGGLSFIDEELNIARPVEVELDANEVQSWLRSLTDIRLSLAARLGIETEEDVMVIGGSSDEAMAAMVEIYDWLGFVQESLVGAIE